MTPSKRTQVRVPTVKQPRSPTLSSRDQAPSARQAFHTAKISPEKLSPEEILQLQRAAGNRAVAELLGSQSPANGSDLVSHHALTPNQIQRKLSKKDQAIKKKVDEFVAAGKHDEALKHICDKYGFTGGKFTIKTVPAMPTAWATCGGEIKAGAEQTLKIGRDLFKKDFTFIVRTIGHEYQHMVQRSQKIPIGNQKEREFLSWSWEALDDSVPKYELKVAAKHAKKALEYYKAMPFFTRMKYLARSNELETLIKKARASK